nr:GIY-YIG nuclease family protein [uncultured Sphaerochaeta sp.]
MYYAYILKSLKDNRYYYGHTENLTKRLQVHNSGKVRSTKGRRPWKVHYFEEYETKAEANRREMYFKSIDGYNWLKLKEII